RGAGGLDRRLAAAGPRRDGRARAGLRRAAEGPGRLRRRARARRGRPREALRRGGAAGAGDGGVMSAEQGTYDWVGIVTAQRAEDTRTVLALAATLGGDRAGASGCARCSGRCRVRLIPGAVSIR